jgi:hypothetical protein
MSEIETELRLLRFYGELMAIAPSLQGRLLCAVGEGTAASGITVAASLADAASLACDPDAAVVKAAMRQGHLDFVVRSLDEAVRILKNELRRARPVSVGLIGDPSEVIAEMQSRGIVADIYVAFAPKLQAPMQAKSILLLDAEHEGPGLAGLLEENRWKEWTMPSSKLPAVSDPVRVRWLQRLPRYHRSHPNAPRAVWLTAEEYAAAMLPED